MMMSMRVHVWVLLLTLFSAWPSAFGADDELARQLPRIPPTSPADAPGTLQVHRDFQARLVAHEPMVADPVSVCHDADGRLYVVEMRGYPFPEREPTGLVRLLVDENGDGTFDRGTDFLKGLNWPTGVLPYDGGVFICAAPDLIYAKDTNGDGEADVRRIVFTGFGTQNVQQLLNGLAWGLDGWIYGAAAGNGGSITSPARPDAAPVVIRGRDFRFKPDGSAFEAVSGGGQFGHVFDDYGHLFVCNNRWHARQIVLPARYLANHPDLIVPGVIADIASDGNEARVYRISPPEPWRVVRSKQYEEKMKADTVFARRLAPAERFPAGYFSSASGLTLYRGHAFPPEYRNSLFVCDVAGNLVHRKTLAANGAIFRADRAEPGVEAEFLASRDIWFRPVNMANTPDGTLLVLDMYRETIEHPLSIPDDIKAHLDLTSGRERGRIWEMVPRAFQRGPRPRLSQARTDELVGHLGNPEAWWRDTAQRLLLERRDPAAIEPLRAIARTHASPFARLLAAWTLEDLGRLDNDLLLTLFTHSDPGIRENAARLAEDRVERSEPLRRALLTLAQDSDARVRFQTALSLGFVRDSKAIDALAAIGSRDAGDRWTRAAVLTACRDRELDVLKRLQASSSVISSGDGRTLLGELSELVGAGRSDEDRTELLGLITDSQVSPSVARAELLGLGRGLPRRKLTIKSVLGRDPARLTAFWSKAVEAATDGARSETERLEAIRLLALAPAESTARLIELLDAPELPSLQIEVIRTLGIQNAPETPAQLVAHWKTLSPTVRREAAEVLLARPAGIKTLLDAIESRALSASDLDPLRRKQLREHVDPSLRERAARVLTGAVESARAAVLREYQPALKLVGRRDRGHEVYRKNCATCHRVDKEGTEVGPNFVTVAAKPPEELLIHILDPNREVAPNFVNYNLATKDGRVVSGVIAEETTAAFTLKRAEGVVEVVPRAQVDQVSATGLSLMPEGLEKSLSPQDIADLVSYIRGLAAPMPAGG